MKTVKGDVRGFTGSRANTANGFVTLRYLTSLSAEVEAWSEAFLVIVLLIGLCPFGSTHSASFHTGTSHKYKMYI